MLIFILKDQRLLFYGFCSILIQIEESIDIVTIDYIQLICSPVVMMSSGEPINDLDHFFASSAPVFSLTLLWAGSAEMTEQNSSNTNKMQGEECKRQWMKKPPLS